MSKNKSNVASSNVSNRRNNHAHNVPKPEILSLDTLAVLSEEDLLERLRSLEEERRRLSDAQYDVRAWEEEISYVRRELQVRKTRRDMHDSYLSQNRDDLYQEVTEHVNNVIVDSELN